MTTIKKLMLLLLCAVNCQVFSQQKSPPKEDQKMKLFFEKAYLHTDRTYYEQGSDIWFSAYLVNGRSTSLTSTSTNLYVELISPLASILDRKIIRLNNGRGNGDFKIKDSIASGWYTIRAYTNWMRNFGDKFIFEKKIFVTSPIKADLKPQQAAQQYSLAFFPEGGSLVEGLNSLVAFKAEDRLGNGVIVHGKIISAKNDTVGSFQSKQDGMGIFTFTPLPGEKYSVETVFNNQPKTQSNLPTALASGMSMHTTLDSSVLKIMIGINDRLFATLANKPITVTLKHAASLIYEGEIKVTRANLVVTVPTIDLPPGVTVVTIYDDKGQANCERLIYIWPRKNVNISLDLAKSGYKPQETVVVNVKTTDESGAPVKASLSLSAIAGIIPNEARTITSYLMLESEVKGEIKNIDRYFDPTNPARFKELDLLLLTQGWRDYIWKKVIDPNFKINYAPEVGISIAGLVRQKIGSKPLPNMNISMFGSGLEGDKLHGVTTNADGRFYINNLKWSGKQNLKLISMNKQGKREGWIVLDTVFKNPISAKPQPSLQIANQIAVDSLNTRKLKLKSYQDAIMLKAVNIVGAPKDIQLFGQNLTSFGYPDQVLEITEKDHDYKTLRHYLLTNANRAHEGTDSLGNEGVEFRGAFDMVRPIVFINNREELIQERTDYFQLTMDVFERVRISRYLDESGNDAFVLYLDVKPGGLLKPNLSILNKDVVGYYAARTFYEPKVENPATIDLRNTIYWTPLITTNKLGEAKVSFRNPDPKGDVAIRAEGITTDGRPITKTIKYKVQ